MIEISVINASTVVTDEEVAKVAIALQTQISRDYFPAWGVDARIGFYPQGVTAFPPAWQLIILDDSPQANILGFHDLSREGLPISKVFARTEIESGSPWSISASHELCEMLGDPCLTLCVFREETGQIVALENCDACEDDRYAHDIDGVLVSDFVYPSWFQDIWEPNQVQFDHGKHITRPFELLSGGYIGVLNLHDGLGWQQMTADKLNQKARAPIGSRRERRRVPGSQWVCSTR